MKIHIAAFAVLASALLASATPAYAGEEIDHGNFIGSPTAQDYTQYRSFTEPGGQTFYVSATGTLTRVALVPECGRCATLSADVTFRLYAVDEAGVPDRGVVLSEEVETVLFDGNRHDVTFSSPAQVTAGSFYALEISGLTSGSYWFMGPGDTYPLGSAFTSSATGTTTLDPTFDLAFLTYVTVPDGPVEPAAPSTPEAPTVVAANPGRVSVSWPAVGTATGYRVYRSTSDSGAIDLVAKSVGTEAVAIVSHAPGKTFVYTVQAYNEHGGSTFSAFAAYTSPHPSRSTQN